MKQFFTNAQNYVALVFLLGLAFIVLAAFMVDLTLGIFVLGIFLVGVAVILGKEIEVDNGNI